MLVKSKTFDVFSLESLPETEIFASQSPSSKPATHTHETEGFSTHPSTLNLSQPKFPDCRSPSTWEQTWSTFLGLH